jgi:hypothetical protein
MKIAMKLAVLIAVLGVHALAQHATDIDCTDLETLHKTICTFADGSGEVISHYDGSTSLTHVSNPSEWSKQVLELKSQESANAQDRVKILEDTIKAQQADEDQYRAEQARKDAATKAENAAFNAKMDSETKALGIDSKKKCIAAGFVWTKVCRVPDGQ